MNKKSVCNYKIVALIVLLFLLGGTVRAAESDLVINEIAWMGTESSHYDEWIELKNNSEEVVNLAKWKLKTDDEDLIINLKGEVEPNAFFILERTDDKTLPEVEADQIYKGGLDNKGQHLKLMKNNKVVQEINDKAGWRAGNKEDYKTMEKGEEWHTSREKGGTPDRNNSEPVPKEEQMPSRPLTSSLEQNNNFWFTLTTGLIVSIFSAAVIYFLNYKLKQNEN